MQKISKNIKDTEDIAEKFLIKLKPNNKEATVVGLSGDLGAGKTTFTQAIARSLGIGRKVNSPTYVIIKKYELKNKLVRKNFLADKTKPVSAGENFSGQVYFKRLFHIDAYRLKNEKELIHLGWGEIIGNKEHLVFVEWPENIIKALPKKHHKVKIEHTQEGNRKFKIKDS